MYSMYVIRAQKQKSEPKFCNETKRNETKASALPCIDSTRLDSTRLAETVTLTVTVTVTVTATPIIFPPLRPGCPFAVLRNVA